VLKVILNRVLFLNINMMRYREIASKLFYNIGVLSLFLFLVLLTYVLYESLNSDELTLFFIVLGLITITILMTLFYLNNFIHGKIDLERSVLTFGNLLMQNEVPLKVVEYVGRIFVYSSAHKIKIAGKIYYYISIESGMADNFK